MVCNLHRDPALWASVCVRVCVFLILTPQERKQAFVRFGISFCEVYKADLSYC